MECVNVAHVQNVGHKTHTHTNYSEPTQGEKVRGVRQKGDEVGPRGVGDRERVEVRDTGADAFCTNRASSLPEAMALRYPNVEDLSHAFQPSRTSWCSRSSTCCGCATRVHQSACDSRMKSGKPRPNSW